MAVRPNCSRESCTMSKEAVNHIGDNSPPASTLGRPGSIREWASARCRLRL